MPLTPTARRDGLVIQELEGETLVYDRKRDKAHCLNRTAALVWKSCNGRFTVDEIAERLRAELQREVDSQVVWLALAQLRRKHLLADSLQRRSLGSGGFNRSHISRRELAIRFGKAALIALPLITTIAAPTPAAAGGSPCNNCFMPPLAICCPTGCPCSTSAACCSGQCSAGTCT